MSSKGGRSPFPNRLWLARKRRGLTQKQVAYLIEKTVDEVSRYERGIHQPELQTLLALEIIYGMPARLLFSELYEQVQTKITEQIESRGASRHKCQALLKDRRFEQEYCSYEENLKRPDLDTAERDEVRRHVTRLARQLAGLEP